MELNSGFDINQRSYCSKAINNTHRQMAFLSDSVHLTGLDVHVLLTQIHKLHCCIRTAIIYVAFLNRKSIALANNAFKPTDDDSDGPQLRIYVQNLLL
jgi:hypothetical protein